MTSSEAFIDAAIWHGDLDRANALLAADPTLARRDVFTAAVLGDDEAVRAFLAADPAASRATSGPRDTTALVYLCFSKYLRLDRARTAAFVRAATALLDAGADPAAGFRSGDEYDEWETAMYGAAGVAQSPELTRLLLDRGVDPNDNETPYHAPETYDNAALAVLVESGRLTADSLATMLVRKTDWHDEAGLTWLLERGANPNHPTLWGKPVLYNAVLSDNSLPMIERLLDHGADPLAIARCPDRGSPRPGQRSIAQLAARRGRGDVLDAFAKRGAAIALDGLERVLSACARHDGAAVSAIAATEPRTVEQLRADGGRFLAAFAGIDNAEGVRLLLDLGVPVDAPFAEGEAYYGVAPQSLAIHVAAWRASHATLPILIARGSPIDVPDSAGRTALMLAVRACVDSYWMRRRKPDSVKALLDAGASTAGVTIPCGYAEIDALLTR